MKKRAITSLLLLLAFMVVLKSQSHGNNIISSIDAEMLRDMINYEDEEKRLFLRTSLCESIEEKYFFNLFLIRDFKKDKTDFTWNIKISEVNNSFDFILGNYNLRFGSGIIFGKRTLFSGNSFDKSFSLSKDKKIITSTGTNPAGSLFGIASDIYFNEENIKTGIVPFFSIQRRYIKEEEISQGYITSTLQTLTYKTEKDGSYNAPVDILTSGLMSYCNIYDLLKIQLYYSQTEIKDPNMNEIKWEFNKSLQSGIKKYSVTGLFIEYTDENISLFIEPAISIREFDNNLKGHGLVWGITVRNRIAYLSIKGKNCDENFFAEHSNSSINPSNIFEITSGFMLCDKYEFGASVYNEKNLNPSYQRDYISGIRKEEIFFNLNPFKIISFSGKAASSGSYRDDLREKKNKISGSTTISPWQNFFFKLRGDIQEMDKVKSFSGFCEIKLLFLQNFSFMAGAGFININNENYIYSTVPPTSEAEMSCNLFKESARAYATKLKYRKEDMSFHIRCEYLKFSSGKELNTEFSLGFIF